MGWSDVSLSLMGPTVEDLKQHFIQRWNYIYTVKYEARDVARSGYAPLDESKYKGGYGYHRRYIKEKVKRLRDGYDDSEPEGDDQQSETGGVRLQICRSICEWSHGKPTEHSIANAYIGIISAAKHFVYIENQFFITATDPAQKPILNMIGRAIVDRIIRAHRDGERFRIVVVIPSIPGFAGDLQAEGSLGTRAIMEFQYRSYITHPWL
jgi:phospholipase D1/2